MGRLSNLRINKTQPAMMRAVLMSNGKSIVSVAHRRADDAANGRTQQKVPAINPVVVVMVMVVMAVVVVVVIITIVVMPMVVTAMMSAMVPPMVSLVFIGHDRHG